MPSQKSISRITFTALLLAAATLFSVCWYSGDGSKIPECVLDTSVDRQDAAIEINPGPRAGTDTGGTDGGKPVAEKRWRFAVVADTRDTEVGFNKAVFPWLLAAILKEHEKSAIDLILVPGDLVYGAVNARLEIAAWIEVMRTVYDAGIAVYPVRGNHDIGCDSSCWNEFFSGSRALPDDGPRDEKGLTYSFSHKNAFFIGFDNYFSQKVNVNWIQGKLDANTLPHVFVFSHEPAFAAYHSDCLDDFAEERDRFWAALGGAGSRVYFCGHDHFYDHARVTDGDRDSSNDIHQFIVGTGGGPLHSFVPPYPGDNSGMILQQVDHAEAYGYVLVEIDDVKVSLTWMALATGACDSWSYRVKR
ncbi:MAG: metallophosphoesterase [Deltaproteobacteria bacterium]|nr:metallophosphoesterase [Deltaproteobacteria bacterium]